MAYGIKYQNVRDANTEYFIDIYKEDYTGDVTNLIIIKCNTEYSDIEYFENIVTKSVEITIQNNFANFFELEPLLSSYDREYFIVIKDNNNNFIFEGYIVSDISNQVFLNGQEIVITANDGLKKLENFTTTLFATYNIYKLIDIIKDCLSFTYNLNTPSIYVNCSLREINQQVSTATLFDQSYIESEIFQNDKEESENCYDVLESILKHFNCVLYYWNNAWYIERVKDLGTVDKHYIIYTPSNTYSVYNTEYTLNIGTDIKFCDESQILNYNPAYKTLKVKLDYKDYDNLINGKFISCTCASTTGRPYQVNSTDIGYRDWKFDASIVISYKFPNGLAGIENDGLSINTYGQYVLDQYNYMAYRNIVNGYYVPLPIDNNYENYIQASKGMYTYINVTAVEDLKIDISYKYQLDYMTRLSYMVGQYYDLYDHPSIEWYLTTWYTNDPARNSFIGRIYLKLDNTNYFIHKDTNQLSPYYNEYICTASNYLLDAVNDKNYIIENECNWTGFSDMKNFTNEFEHSIKLSAQCVSTMIDNNTKRIVLGILMPGYKSTYVNNVYSNVKSVTATLKSAIFGDVKVGVTSPETDINYIVANVNNKYENIYEDEFFIFDTSNYNCKNSMFLDQYRTRTNLWVDDFSTNQKSLIDRNIEDRFQIFNKKRTFFECDLFDYKKTFNSNLKPFTLMYESNINKDYFLNGYNIDLNTNTYNSVKLFEYVDNDGYFV